MAAVRGVEVLHDGAAGGDGHELSAAADAQHREPSRLDLAGQGQVACSSKRVAQNNLLVGRLAPEFRRVIVATDEQNPVEVIQRPSQRAGVLHGRNEKRRGAGGEYRFDIGIAQAVRDLRPRVFLFRLTDLHGQTDERASRRSHGASPPSAELPELTALRGTPRPDRPP